MVSSDCSRTFPMFPPIKAASPFAVKPHIFPSSSHRAPHLVSLCLDVAIYFKIPVSALECQRKAACYV